MITAYQRTVAKVLGDDYLHEIPAFQRPYAWRSQEAEQLLDDLLNACEHGASGSDYFLGSLVLIKESSKVRSIVVDGQQRLTTLTILCAVLRDAATSENERLALRKAVYVEPDPFAGVTESLRLQPQAADSPFFLESIQKDCRTAQSSPAWQPKNESQKLMWSNSQVLRQRIAQIDDKSRQNLVVYLLNKCVLVTVETQTRSDALRIFKVLNDRGLDLSNSDVIKADLLAKVSSDEPIIEHYANIWRNLEVELGRDEFEGLLEYIRFLHEKGKSRGTLADAYADRFRAASSDDVKKFIINELSPAKDALFEILQGDASNFPADCRARAVESLAGLRLLPNNDWTAVALAVFQQHGLTEVTVTLLEQLEGLAWVQQLLRRYDTQRLARYARCLEALKSAYSPAGVFTLTDDEAKKASTALQGNLYGEYPVRIVRALLQRLDRLISDQPLFTEIMSVEHILPQNPNHPEWEVFTSHQRVIYTHALGNLVLLSRKKNSSASNLPFAQKKKSYFGLGDGKWPTYASVNELSGLDVWTGDELSARQIRHCRILAKRWSFVEFLNPNGFSAYSPDFYSSSDERITDGVVNIECRAENYEILRKFAENGYLPAPPDFSADTHERYRKRLQELIDLAISGNLSKLISYDVMGPNATVVSSSPRMMLRYQELCIIALEARNKSSMLPR